MKSLQQFRNCINILTRVIIPSLSLCKKLWHFLYYWRSFLIFPSSEKCTRIIRGDIYYVFQIGLRNISQNFISPLYLRVKLSIVGSLRDREVAGSASDRQGSNFESCVWRTVSSHSSHHPQEVLLAQFSLYVHKCDVEQTFGAAGEPPWSARSHSK